MIDAHTFTIRQGGRWHGRYGTAPCPVCQPERRKDQNALTLAEGSNGRLLLDCKKRACAFREILRAAGIAPGGMMPPGPAALAQREAERQAEVAKRERNARRIWQKTQHIQGSLAETYLWGRGITCSLPETLRFHPACWHPTGRRLPAMVALVEGSDGVAVHRTYLHPDGRGKATVEPERAMLGSTRCGAVRVSNSHGPLVVAEGIETALSLLSGLLRRPATVCAALSASNMARMRLPPQAGRLIIANDGDRVGREAARTLAERAHALGWQVSLLPAPDGLDWNDILNMKGEN